MHGKVLIIAGSDSGGGAGIQADIKTVTALDGFAATAITALTAQNTLGVQAIQEVPNEFIAEQIKSVLTDIGADVIKTGMLHSASVIETVRESLEKYGKDIPLIVDPVMVAKGGAKLLEPAAVIKLKSLMIKKAALVTPNIPEAEILAEMPIKTVKDMEVAAEKIMNIGAEAVLVKGGHLSGNDITDILLTANGVKKFSSKRIISSSTHGTGCTLASAIATYLAKGNPIEKAVELARYYVITSIETAEKIGQGHGPLNHSHTFKQQS